MKPRLENPELDPRRGADPTDHIAGHRSADNAQPDNIESDR
jgi:hypothetical protein